MQEGSADASVSELNAMTAYAAGSTPAGTEHCSMQLVEVAPQALRIILKCDHDAVGMKSGGTPGEGTCH